MEPSGLRRRSFGIGHENSSRPSLLATDARFVLVSDSQNIGIRPHNNYPHDPKQNDLLVVVSGEEGEVGAIAKSDSHGGFDNDPNTMNSVLTRILGEVPGRVFTERDLQF